MLRLYGEDASAAAGEHCLGNVRLSGRRGERFGHCAELVIVVSAPSVECACSVFINSGELVDVVDYSERVLLTRAYCERAEAVKLCLTCSVILCILVVSDTILVSVTLTH